MLHTSKTKPTLIYAVKNAKKSFSNNSKTSINNWLKISKTNKINSMSRSLLYANLFISSISYRNDNWNLFTTNSIIKNTIINECIANLIYESASIVTDKDISPRIVYIKTSLKTMAILLFSLFRRHQKYLSLPLYYGFYSILKWKKPSIKSNKRLRTIIVLFAVAFIILFTVFNAIMCIATVFICVIICTPSVPITLFIQSN